MSGLVTCPDEGCRGHKLMWPTYTECPWCGRSVVLADLMRVSTVSE